jgi:hypothetical protein
MGLEIQGKHGIDVTQTPCEGIAADPRLVLPWVLRQRPVTTNCCRGRYPPAHRSDGWGQGTGTFSKGRGGVLLTGPVLLRCEGLLCDALFASLSVCIYTCVHVLYGMAYLYSLRWRTKFQQQIRAWTKQRPIPSLAGRGQTPATVYILGSAGASKAMQAGPPGASVRLYAVDADRPLRSEVAYARGAGGAARMLARGPGDRCCRAPPAAAAAASPPAGGAGPAAGGAGACWPCSAEAHGRKTPRWSSWGRDAAAAAAPPPGACSCGGAAAPVWPGPG